MDAYETGDITGGRDLAVRYMDAVRWSARSVQATSRLARA
jgi:hypothetical protein